MYAIWLPVLAGDSREGLDAAVLRDARVRQFWDPDQASGRWFADSANLGLDPPLLWDAYLVFGPKARWDRIPHPLKAWGSPVIEKSDDLRSALKPYLGS
jgi:hypothetical protein